MTNSNMECVYEKHYEWQTHIPFSMSHMSPDLKKSIFFSGLVKCGLQQSACNAVNPVGLALIKEVVVSTFEFKISNISIIFSGGQRRAMPTKNGLQIRNH